MPALIYRYLFLYIQPFADSFGLLFSEHFSISLLTRLSLTLLGGIIFVTSPHLERLSKYLVITSVLLLSLTSFIHFFTGGHDISILKTELTTLPKLFYLPLSIFVLYSLSKDRIFSNKDFFNAICLYGFFVISSVLIGFLTDQGGVIKGRGSGFQGYKGFLIGANEVGLMLILTFPFVYQYLKEKFPFGRILCSTFYLITGILVFTKSSLAVFIVFGYLVIYSMSIKQRFFMGVLSAYPITIFIQRNIGSILDFINSSFFSTLAKGQIVDFLFRGRDSYINAITDGFLSLNKAYLLFFGMGEYLVRKVSEIPLNLKPGAGSTFEMDGFDLFSFYGFIGLFAYLLTIFTAIKIARPNFIVPGSRFVIGLTLLHSFMAGHVLIFSPQVTTIISLFVLFNHQSLNKEDVLENRFLSPAK